VKRREPSEEGNPHVAQLAFVAFEIADAMLVLEDGRQNADDGVRHSIELDRLTHHVGRAGEGASMKRGADDDDIGRAGKVFAERKVAPQDGRHAENAEELRRHIAGGNANSFAATRQIEIARCVASRPGQRVVLVADIEKLVRRRRHPREAHRLELAVDIHELVRLRKGQRPEHDGIEHAEDGGHPADGQRQREHDRHRIRPHTREALDGKMRVFSNREPQFGQTIQAALRFTLRDSVRECHARALAR
jgi:hypothetical protein